MDYIALHFRVYLSLNLLFHFVNLTIDDHIMVFFSKIHNVI